MPKPTDVSLEIRNHASQNRDGWTDTTASDKSTYSYKYTGGHDGAGGMTFVVGKGAHKFLVSLLATTGTRCRIDSITFEGDDPDEAQLMAHPHPDGSHHISNRNTKAMNARYKITVLDPGNGNVRIPCDPQIINKKPV